MAAAMFNRAIKYRAYPTAEQAILFTKTFGCVRYIWNQMLGDSIRFYEETDKLFIPTPAKYKKCAPFLKEVDSLALCNAQLALKGAYSAFFARNSGFPEFKSKKKCKNKYTTNMQLPKSKQGEAKPTIYIGKDFVHLPKVGDVHIAKHRAPKNGWHLKSATVELAPTGKYYISVLFEFTEDIQPAPIEATLGLDYSSPHFYEDSNGNTAEYPRYYRQTEDKLARAQQKVSRTKPGSSNYLKQKAKIARIHEKIVNQRKNFCHTLSTAIAKQYDAVFVEDLDLRGLAGALSLGKSTNDNGFGLFRDMLAYKLPERGKTFLKIDRFYPSSQICSACGYQNKEVKDLSVREWVCPKCGTRHNRDHNAATNIQHRGLELLALCPIQT